MPATSVAILSLLPPTTAPFLSGARAERAAFSPLAWSQRNLRLVPTTPLTKPSRCGDRQQGDVVTRPVSVLTRPWSTTVETLRRCDGLVDDA
jgi:hypothetical protein